MDVVVVEMIRCCSAVFDSRELMMRYEHYRGVMMVWSPYCGRSSDGADVKNNSAETS